MRNDYLVQHGLLGERPTPSSLYQLFLTASVNVTYQDGRVFNDYLPYGQTDPLQVCCLFLYKFFFFTYLRESLVWIIPDIRYVVTIIKFTSPDQIPMLINCKELNNFKNQLFIATVIKWITDVRVVCSVTFYILINCI